MWNYPSNPWTARHSSINDSLHEQGNRGETEPLATRLHV